MRDQDSIAFPFFSEKKVLNTETHKLVRVRIYFVCPVYSKAIVMYAILKLTWISNSFTVYFALKLIYIKIFIRILSND